MRDTIQLGIDARRTLAYTYAIRFHLRGIKRQAFFDMLQQQMESSLEKFQKKLDEETSKLTAYDKDMQA